MLVLRCCAREGATGKQQNNGDREEVGEQLRGMG